MVFNNISRYEGAIGTSIVKVFDMTVASTGLSAKRLKLMGIKYKSSITHSGSHAGYYPGANPLTVKLIFDPDNGKILGAQVLGIDGVDKRIDQIALLIKFGGTVSDLTKIEHAYAPPYSSAKDPIAIAGYVATNIINGAMETASWREMLDLNNEDNCVLDVRTQEEYELGYIPGAINIPLEDIRSRIAEIPHNIPVYVYCAIGLRGYLASRILIENGYKNVKNLSGGYKTYFNSTANINSFYTPEKCNGKVNNRCTENNLTTIKIDACGLQCPGPIIKVKQAIDEIDEGQRVEISSTDAGFVRDVRSWCDSTGNIFVSDSLHNGKYTVLIEKKISGKVIPVENPGNDLGKTFILFSDDLDKAVATFILANGAAATGRKVSIFFTFWGLNAIKKTKKSKTDKDIYGKMFSIMLPSSSKKLKLSKMNMGGIGSRMMRNIMKEKGVDSLESLRAQALAQGVEFIACQMSMDVMGVKKEELLNEVTIGGVATYMGRADKSNVNLFI